MSQAQEINGLKRNLQKCATKYAAASERVKELEQLSKELAEALQPFANITPSSFYASDGSENEGYFAYRALLAEGKAEFTGSDLARARAILKKLKDGIAA